MADADDESERAPKVKITGMPMEIPTSSVNMVAFSAFAAQQSRLNEQLAPILEIVAKTQAKNLEAVHRVMETVVASNLSQIQASLAPALEAMAKSLRTVQIPPIEVAGLQTVLAVIAEQAKYVDRDDVEIPEPADLARLEMLDVVLVVIAYMALAVFGTQLWQGLSAGDREAALNALGNALVTLLVLRDRTT